MTPPKKRDKVKVKKVKAFAVVSFGRTLKSPKIIQDYKGKLAVDKNLKLLKSSVGNLFGWEKIIPVTITYKSGNGR